MFCGLFIANKLNRRIQFFITLILRSFYGADVSGLDGLDGTVMKPYASRHAARKARFITVPPQGLPSLIAYLRWRYDLTAVRSVSEIKKNTTHHSKSNNGMPRSGSRMREMYDALRTGRVVNIYREFGGNASKSMYQLRDFYGMEIEAVTGGYRLVGEWDGPYYVPVERILSL